MDTVESLSIEVGALKLQNTLLSATINSLSAKIDIVNVGIGELHSIFMKIQVDLLIMAQDYDNVQQKSME